MRRTRSELERKCEHSLAVVASLWEAQGPCCQHIRVASPPGRRLQIAPSILMAVSSLTHFLRRLCYIRSMRGVAIVVFCVLEVRSEIERFGRTRAGVGKPSEGHVMQIDRA